MTRFDEFVEARSIVVTPVDRLTGYLVEVGVPPGWEPFDCVAGVRVWVCGVDPRSEEFCANAVLTMHQTETPLNAYEVFDMLVDQQLQSMPGCRELQRELAVATEGDGVVGTLEMQIDYEAAAITSRARSRIITTEHKTLIAQLTVTALVESPVAHSDLWLSVKSGAAIGSVSTGHHQAVPLLRTQDVVR